MKIGRLLEGLAQMFKILKFGKKSTQEIENIVSQAHNFQFSQIDIILMFLIFP
uniref:Uncharacterized protein n=1 Tax=Rhizophora mucronata TaxID=61149 RepID=A0A2P2PV41_RHIMU